MTCPPDRPYGTGAIAGREVVAVPSRPIKSCFIEDGRFGDAFTDKGACRSDIGRRRRMIERGDTTALQLVDGRVVGGQGVTMVVGRRACKNDRGKNLSNRGQQPENGNRDPSEPAAGQHCC